MITELTNVELESGEFIVATSDHTFYSPHEENWIEASDLFEGVELFEFDGRSLLVASVETFEKSETVYNLSVANNHNYFVGESAVLAHNCYQKPSWKLYHNGKHIAPKGLSSKEIRKGTKNGPAKYYLSSAKDVQELELKGWRKGIPLKSNPNYKIVEHPDVIGAKFGRDTRWQRLEYDKTSDTIHGHPITREEFQKYMRDTVM